LLYIDFVRDFEIISGFGEISTIVDDGVLGGVTFWYYVFEIKVVSYYPLGAHMIIITNYYLIEKYLFFTI